MTCRKCNHEYRPGKFGTYGKRKIQRYRCSQCKATFSEPSPKLGTHHTDPQTAAKALTLMLEGMSVRAIERFTGLHSDTILSLMNTAAAKPATCSTRECGISAPGTCRWMKCGASCIRASRT